MLIHLKKALGTYCFVLKATRVFPIPTQAGGQRMVNTLLMININSIYM